MQTSKKAILVSLTFILCFCLISSVLIGASDRQGEFCETASLSGNSKMHVPVDTNYLFCGASHCAMGLIPDVIDPLLNVKSYNLSALSIKLDGRYELLKHVTKDCPIDHVVLEISFDTLERSSSIGRDGEVYIYRYFRDYLGLNYILSHPFLNEYLSMVQDRFNKTMNDGFTHVLRRVLGNTESVTFSPIQKNKAENRGFEAYPSVSVTLTPEEAAQSYQQEALDTDIRQQNLKMLEMCIDLCRRQGIEVILIVTPLPDYFIWQHSGWDDFYCSICEISADNGCALYDFNLLFDRYTLFNDDYSFYDDTHLSEVGANVLSRKFAEVVSATSSGKKINTLFYNSYEEMIHDSPYVQFLK